jgi:monofunctional biosynthetic peptidoglycan transglycosylase
MEYNKKKPKKKRGASTISQQVAKNVFLWQGRSWIRKGLEVYFTLMIETLWSKKRIMEMYLNVIEMGDGIFGIQAAAQIYFNKDANKLTREECAMIAAALPNPKKYKVNPASPYILKRTPWVLQQMYQLEPDPNIIKLLQKADFSYYSSAKMLQRIKNDTLDSYFEEDPTESEQGSITNGASDTIQAGLNKVEIDSL